MEVFRDGSVRTSVDGAPYTVHAPPRPVDWRPDEQADKPFPTISIGSAPEHTPAKRVTATTLVAAVAEREDRQQDTEELAEDSGAVSGESGLTATTFGTVSPNYGHRGRSGSRSSSV